MKWQTKESLSWSKFAIDVTGSLQNHTFATPLRVTGNDLQIISSKVCWRFNIVLNTLMWSRGSLLPSYTSSYGRQNLGGKGYSRMLVVKGESVLLIMPSRFIAVFPFMAFLTSSNYFLMLFIIRSLPRVDCAVYLEVSFLLLSGL